MDKKLILDGKEYSLVNTYGLKFDADRDAQEFNSTGRWHTVVQQDNGKYELYARKIYVESSKRL